MHHSLALTLWYFVSAVIYERHYESFISWAIQTYKFVYLPGVTLKNNQKT